MYTRPANDEDGLRARTVGWDALVRLNQFDMRHAQGLGELVQRHDRGIPPPAFEIADVLLSEAGPLRELFLRQVALKPDAPHIAADESAHVHTKGSQAPPPGVYLL